MRKQTRRILTEGKLDEISAALHASPRKSLRCLAQQTGVCKASAGVATKLLKLKSYRIPSFHELQSPDYNRRLPFCNWMLEKVNNEEIDHKSIFFSDETWFHLHGHQIMMCKIYLSFNQLTSVNTLPPARLAWRQTRSFRPAGLEENFRDRMSQTRCIISCIDVYLFL